MKVITPGQLPQDKVYQHTCSNCGCVFTFMRADARYVHDQRDGESLAVKCPQQGCDREGWVNP